MLERDDIKIIVDVFGLLCCNGVIDLIIWGVSVFEFIVMLFKCVEVWEGDGLILDWCFKELMDKFGIGFWMMYFGFYGFEDVIKVYFEEVKKIVVEKVLMGCLIVNFYLGKSFELYSGG